LVELSFTIDFTGSDHIIIENSDDLVIETPLKAESAETLAIVKEYPDSILNW
jgi:hypothetical protein